MNISLAIPVIILIFIFLLEGISPYFKGRTLRTRHAFPHFLLAGINTLITVGLFSGLTISVSSWTVKNSYGLLNFINAPTYVVGIISFLMFDVWMYAWHRANHRIPFLWLFHRAHHTDIEMDTTTALRFHPIEIIISSILNLGIIVLLGLKLQYLLIYRIIFNSNVFFHHSNIALPEKWDRRLRAIIVTPNMHRVHHSELQPETDSNYSSVFSFWDRIMQTFKKREDTLTISYGIKGMKKNKWLSFKGMLVTPFMKVKER